MPPTTIVGLTVHGTLPAALSGRLLAIGADDGFVHSVHVHPGRNVSYRSRRVTTDVVPRNIVAVGGAILALVDRSLAYELSANLETLRRVDLAGQNRGLSAYPKRDPITGDLHLIAVAPTGAQAHVVVSSGALTRTSRTVAGAPERITHLAITRERVVFLADGFVGVAPREGEAHTTWVTTGIDAAYLVHACDADDAVVIHALTPSLERWTLHATTATMDREVLDPTPRRSAHINDHAINEPLGYLWSTGEGTADKHDLVTSSCVRHAFRPDRQPGDLVFVVDDTRRHDADGGWLVGFVHHESRDETDLVVLDAADITRPAIATVGIPRRIARGLHSTWIPSTSEGT